MEKRLGEVKGWGEKDRREWEGYVGVERLMWICEEKMVEVGLEKEEVLEEMVSGGNVKGG